MTTSRFSLPALRRTIVVGVLNIPFSIFYLYVSYATILGLAEFLNETPAADLGVFLYTNLFYSIAPVLIAIGLLTGGVLLLRNRALGRRLTRLTTVIAFTAFLLSCGETSMLLMVGLDMGTLLLAILGLILRFAYPLAVYFVLAPEPFILGLE